MTAVESRGVALVTGGAVRVGRAISAALARAGFDVVVNYRRSAAAAEALVAELRGENHSAAARQADVTDPDAAAELIEFAAARGRLALLVNNAAVFERRAWLDVDSEHWNRHLRLNLEAPFRLSQMASRIMWQTGGGRIVNICGTVGIEPRGEYAAYCVAKAGLDTLTRCSAAALAPRVQVNGVAPGAILFPEGTPEEERQRVLERVPAGRVGSPEDVAAAVLFFADAPDYVTGTILPVDGGASAHDG